MATNLIKDNIFLSSEYLGNTFENVNFDVI